jgi:hypothetical protein
MYLFEFGPMTPFHSSKCPHPRHSIQDAGPGHSSGSTGMDADLCAAVPTEPGSIDKYKMLLTFTGGLFQPPNISAPETSALSITCDLEFLTRPPQSPLIRPGAFMGIVDSSSSSLVGSSALILQSMCSSLTNPHRNTTPGSLWDPYISWEYSQFLSK